MINNERRKINSASFIWNIIGSMVGAASSFVLLLCVTRTVGAKEGGIFSLAFSTAQILLTVGKFGVRFFQATDIKGEISFATYLKTRVWFCLAMILLDCVYVYVTGCDFRKAWIFILVALIKMVDAAEDVFHGQLQCKGRMDIAGILLTVRNVSTILAFALSILVFKDLLWTCGVTAFVSVIGGLILNIAVTNYFIPVKLKLERQQIKQLIQSCMPLFIGSFLSIYIYNAPKYALDYWGTEEEVACYSIIFMPAFVINLFSEFVFKPLLTTIAKLWQEREYKKFKDLIYRLLGNIVLITIVMLIGAYAVGAKLLSIVYSVDIMQYKIELMILMVSGGLSATVYLLFNVLASVRAQNLIIMNYGIVSCIVTVLSWVFARYNPIMGASVAYFISEIILVTGMLLSTMKKYREG